MREGGVLTKGEILDRLRTRNLFVTPLIDADQQVASAVDVRLGTRFIAFRRTRLSILDVTEGTKKDVSSRISEYQEKVFVGLGEHLVLHPQQFVLGSTLEYIGLPTDLIVEVIGRSSWGRLGLIISAATLVHPGYAGVVTLELANEGDTPIALYPGVRIAQLVFHKVLDYKSPDMEIHRTKYDGSTEPSFSKLHEDEDLEIIKKLKKKLEGDRVSRA